jgi:hypothetical protein
MNIEGRLADFRAKLQEQIKLKEQANANIYYLSGAIDVLVSLQKDAEMPITELKEEVKE